MVKYVSLRFLNTSALMLWIILNSACEQSVKLERYEYGIVSNKGEGRSKIFQAKKLCLLSQRAFSVIDDFPFSLHEPTLFNCEHRRLTVAH